MKILNNICFSELNRTFSASWYWIGTVNPPMRFDLAHEIKSNRFDRSRTAGKMFVLFEKLRFQCNVNVVAVFRVMVRTAGTMAR